METTRESLLDAAAAVMRDRGYARTRTRHVAELAGYSEATLFKYFSDKTALMLAVLQERSPAFHQLAEALRNHAGSLEDALTRVAVAAIAFYSDNFPMLASIFSDPPLLAAHRESLRARNLGPHQVNEAVIGFFRAEVEAGRIDTSADLYAVAGLLVGACMQHAFLGHMGWAGRRADEEAARSFARTAIEGVVS